ncbi:hypothetical protein Pla108_35130 [Botrimarina colliarenosi]|uniref:DNA primase/polymerase bifunctional N-terminal domain-containing protein n=1 Tax=Botrimarina colliarenosi TaxID=2528001 RepID=A0A5C6A7R8_9BACT|nr:AAA family ATPase [Botrimarina colliarenosi]TWT95365.1 hypothetical protein Pla108_35130 [Botrimarina colliarenosi]
MQTDYTAESHSRRLASGSIVAPPCGAGGVAIGITTTGSTLNHARAYAAAGLSVVPIKTDGSKSPRGSWKVAQARPATLAEVERAFTGECGVGIVHGAASGNSEVLDIDTADLLEPFVETLDYLAPGLVARLCVVRTPRPGFHLYYRCERVGGNQKLAMRPPAGDAAEAICLIETRGQGGQTLAPGCPPSCHPMRGTYEHHSGPPLTELPTITLAERDALLTAARSFDETPIEEPVVASTEAAGGSLEGLSPGDDYNQRNDWASVLEPHGWILLHRQGDRLFWRRPGKVGEGCSATTGNLSAAGNDLLCVFSTNAHPFAGPTAGRPCSSHTKFDAYARLHHDGDHAVAARELRRIGYGDRPAMRYADAGLADMNPSAPPLSAPRAVRRPSIVCMSDVEPREVNWLWPGRLAAGRLSLLVGMPGCGKSFLTCDLAARITTGTAWPDGPPCRQGSVLFIACEDDPADTIRPRLDAHHADPARVHLLKGVERTERGETTELAFSLADVDALEETLKRLSDCRLVVIDPIGSFLGGRTDAHRDNEVRAVLAPIARLAELYGVAVLIVAHRRKSAGTFADDMALGSRAFTGIARSVWHLSLDSESKGRRLLLPGKNNLGPEAGGLAFSIVGSPARLTWEHDPVAMTADEALARETGGGSGETSALDEASRWLKEILASGPRAGKELKALARGDGISERTLDRAKVDLRVENSPDGFGGPWLWRLPQQYGASLCQDFAESAKDQTLADSGETGPDSEPDGWEAA